MMCRGKVGKIVMVFGRDRVVEGFGFVRFGLLCYGRRRDGWCRMIVECSGSGGFGRVMCWVRRDVASLVDDLFVVGGMGYTLGIVVRCMAC
jgi:hypothetical protein